MRRVLLILLGLLLLAALVAAAVTLSRRDETDAVSVHEAARTARQADDGSPEAGLRPHPGTYTYAGSGRESIDTLGGSEHVFPPRIPVTVELAADTACEWTMTLIYVRQHRERRRYCTDERGVRELSFGREIEFFRQTDRTKFTCSEGAFRWQKGARPGSAWTYECEGSGRTLSYTVTYLGSTRMRVGTTRVPAQHVRVETRLSGASEGTDRSEYWYAPSCLPLRWTTDLDVRTDSVLGRTRFREQTDYRLRNTAPQ